MSDPVTNFPFQPPVAPMISDLMAQPQVGQPHDFHIQGLDTNPISLATQLHAASPDGLTPCSVAYSLVYQYNRRGHDTAYLDIRLYVGYRECSSVGDGCAVENKVLFGILADIC